MVKFIDNHQLVFSPFRRTHLPLEVLTQIFHYAAPVVDIDSWKVRHTSRSIWAFGRVCSDWRNAMLSLGSLWTDLRIDISPFNVNCASVLEGALVRSKNMPLKITLDVIVSQLHCKTPVPDFDRHLSAVINKLVAVSHRWHTIELRSIPAHHLRLFAKVQGRLPILQNLTYRSRYQIPPAVFVDTPSLRKANIHIDNINKEFVPASIQLPWLQLRECCVGCIQTPRQELDLLRLCPNIEAYKLASLNHGARVGSSNMLCLPDLHTLTLDVPYAINLVDNLILPSLNLIILSGSSDKEAMESITPHIEDLLSRSSCNLYNMEINYIGPVAASVLFDEIRLETLTSLRIAYDNPYELPVEILTVKPENHSVTLPRLQKLHLHPRNQGDSYLSPNLNWLVQLVESRWLLTEDLSKTMNRLSLVEYRPVEYLGSKPPPVLAGVLAPLICMRNEGLELDIPSFYLDEKMDIQDRMSTDEC